VISITSIEYRDTTDGSLQTVSTDDYELNEDHSPALIKFSTVPDYDSSYMNPLRVTYVSGYGAAASDVPQPLKQAVLLLVGYWYEMREAVISPTGNDPKELPLGAQWLLKPYKFFYS